ncbi:MAG: anhydro-N-acetylmuramic acid kinase [Alphaproteobacteria bacterium]
MKTRDKYSYLMKSNKTCINSMGLMSGTSLDGLDIALIRTNALNKFKLRQFNTYEYSKLLKKSIRDFIKYRKNVNQVNNLITQFNAKCIKSFMIEFNIKKQDIDIIGMHGHTIFHNPQENWTWQLSNGKALSNLVNIPVISNLRYRDVCLGGEGAPLVGIWHKTLLAGSKDPVFPCVFLNIGGVSNITYVENEYDIPYCFDIGVGNGPIDMVMEEYFGISYDKDGKISLKGIINKNSIHTILTNEWFKKLPPKSIDKSSFNNFIKSCIEHLCPEDKAATLSKLISLQLKESLNFFALRPKCLYICGGGSKNEAIMNGLKEEYDKIILPLDANWDSDAMEAQAFAYLASRSLKSISYTWEKITGVRNEASGGLLNFPD